MYLTNETRYGTYEMSHVVMTELKCIPYLLLYTVQNSNSHTK